MAFKSFELDLDGISDVFLMHFGRYFGFFTSETISEAFLMHFGFLDW